MFSSIKLILLRCFIESCNCFSRALLVILVCLDLKEIRYNHFIFSLICKVILLWFWLLQHVCMLPAPNDIANVEEFKDRHGAIKCISNIIAFVCVT